MVLVKKFCTTAVCFKVLIFSKKVQEIYLVETGIYSKFKTTVQKYQSL